MSHVIKTSNQLWKVIVALILLFGGVGASWIARRVTDLQGVEWAQSWLSNVDFAGVVLALVGMVLLFAGIRCPRCRSKWIWLAASGKLGSKGVDSLIDLHQCPTCEYPNRDAREIVKS